MSRLRTATAVTAAWMAFVWGTRVRNAVGDDGLSDAGLTRALLLSGLGLVGAGVLAAVAWRRRGALAARVVAAASAAVWAWRGIAILFGGHEAAFVVVHEVLAVISIGLAAWVWVVAGRSRSEGEFRTDGQTPLRSRPLWDSPSR